MKEHRLTLWYETTKKAHKKNVHDLAVQEKVVQVLKNSLEQSEKLIKELEERMKVEE